MPFHIHSNRTCTCARSPRSDGAVVCAAERQELAQTSKPRKRVSLELQQPFRRELPDQVSGDQRLVVVDLLQDDGIVQALAGVEGTLAMDLAVGHGRSCTVVEVGVASIEACHLDLGQRRKESMEGKSD